MVIFQQKYLHNIHKIHKFAYQKTNQYEENNST